MDDKQHGTFRCDGSGTSCEFDFSLTQARARDGIMRGHEADATIAMGNEELVGATSQSRLHRQEQSSLNDPALAHSAAVRDTEFTSMSYPGMALDRDSTAGSFLVEQS